MIRVNLDVILKERDISIREFTRMIDYGYETVRKMHNNDLKCLPVDLLDRTCKKLNVTIDELVEYNIDK